MQLFVYTTTRKRFVIFTCRYFKLSWNATALIQSNCRNFSCNSHKRTDIVTLNKQLLISELFFTTCFSSRNFIPLEYGGPQLSRQKQKHHGKTKNLTAKTKYLIAKPSVFGMRLLVLPWGILYLPWGFWFCRDSSGPPYWNLKTNVIVYSIFTTFTQMFTPQNFA